MKIGIIGAENSHTVGIAKTLNVEKKVNGFTVDYVWGETEELAKEAAKEGEIPHTVRTPKEMLSEIDAIVVDHRHPKYHLKAALPFIEQGIPAFIDKPFCYRAAEGKQFLQMARKNKAAVVSYSALPMQQSAKRFIRKMEGLGDILAGATSGPCDVKSKYGGVFFYGIHQVDMALEAFGLDVTQVLVTQKGNCAAAQLLYASGKIVTLNLIKEGTNAFTVTALGSKGAYHQTITFDKNVHMPGIRLFTTMFKTGKEPISYKRILKPVQVLEAMEKSLKSGKKEKVGS